MDTKRYALKEILTICNGKDHSNCADGVYPVYGSGGIIRYIDVFLYAGESILLPRKGTLSNIQYVSGHFYTVDTCYYTKINKKIVNPYYLYRLLRSMDLSGLDSGASIPSMTTKTYYGIKVDLPNIEYQNKIADIIKKYDKLIDNNCSRIKLLEYMAENLYKEWFVRFRFPGHETTEFVNGKLGKIPKSFQLLKMKDVIEYYVGGGWGNDDMNNEFSKPAYVIRGTDFPAVKIGNLNTCPYRFHKDSNFKSRKLDCEDIIIEASGGTAEQPVGRTIYIDSDIISRFNGNVICASFCKLLRLNKEVISPIYFYYWMQFLYETRIIEKFQLQSTGIINFKFEYFLKKGDVLIPTMAVMKKFEEKVLPIRQEIMILAKHNNNLIKQCDLLLPRLMSGKLEV